MSQTFKERAEALAMQIILTQILAHAFREDAKFARVFTRGIEFSIDNFDFRDGWSEAQMLRGREFVRSAADAIIAPALNAARRPR